MRNQINKSYSVFWAIACAVLFLYLPQWHVAALAQQSINIWLLVVVALNISYVFLIKTLPLDPKKIEWVGAMFGWALILVFSIQYGAFLQILLFPIVVAYFSPQKKRNFLFLVCCTPLGLWYARMHGVNGFGFWWLAFLWLRFVIIQFSTIYRSENFFGRLRCLLFFLFAPPFLISPLPMKWLQYDVLVAARRENIKLDKFLLAAVGGFLASLFYLVISKIDVTNLFEGAVVFFLDQSWFKAICIGYFLFLKRFLLFWGLTEVTRAWLLLMNYDVKNDYSTPFFAKNPLEYWSRYSGYAKDFLVEHIFYPFILRIKINFPRWILIAIALIPVFVFLAIEAKFSPISSIGAPFDSSFSWIGCFWYSLIAYLWTVLVYFLYRASADGLVHKIFYITHCCLFYVFTQISIGFLFWSSYSLRWNGNSILNIFNI